MIEMMDMVWSWEVHLKSGKMILKTIFPWYVCPSFLVSAWFLGQCYWHRMIVKQAWLSDCHRSNEHQWMMSWETISQNDPSQYPIINRILQFNRLYWYHRYLMGQFMGFSSFTVSICWAGMVSREFRTFFLDVQKKSLEMGTKWILGPLQVGLVICSRDILVETCGW